MTNNIPDYKDNLFFEKKMDCKNCPYTDEYCASGDCERDNDLTEQEIWKGMSEFDNEYEVSNLGRFRSVDRVIIRKGSQTRIKGRIIKGQQDAYGYVTMTIKNKQVKAHRLVAKYFVENPLNKNQVNHKNGIKNDNRAVNLEWCSHEENMKHLYLTMPFEHKNSKQKRMEREDLIRKLTQFVESRTIEDVKNSWVSAKNILDVLCVKYNKVNIPMFYEEWKEYQELDEDYKRNVQLAIRFSLEADILKALLKECRRDLIMAEEDCGWDRSELIQQIDEVLK